MEKFIQAWLRDTWQSVHDNTASPLAYSMQDMEFPFLKACGISTETWKWMLVVGKTSRVWGEYWEFDISAFPDRKYSNLVKNDKSGPTPILHMDNPVFIVKRLIPTGMSRKSFWPHDECIMFPLYINDAVPIREFLSFDKLFTPGATIGLVPVTESI